MIVPPIPTPKPHAATKGSPASSVGEKSPPPTAPRGKNTKAGQLEIKITRFYMMMGTILRPFGRWIPQLEPIGDALKEVAEEASKAWMDLADENPAVKKYLENLTSASTWGNVIGIHFAVVAAAMPKQTAKLYPMPGVDPLQFAKDMGLSDQELEAAMRMAGMDTGGPGDTVKSDRSPDEVPDLKDKEKKLADAQKKFDEMQSKSAIVTPDELGVENTGSEYDTPMSPNPNPPS